MDRPRVICHMLTYVDGKINHAILRSERAEEARSHYDELHRLFRADAFACGRMTMESRFMDDSFPDLAPYLEAVVPSGDFIAKKHADFYAVTFDRKGRLGWKSGRLETENPGYNGAHIIEVVTDEAPKPCLAYLRETGVSYILADTVTEALRKLKDRFGIKLLLLEGGSEINGAFLREDVVDELSLVTAPLLSDAKAKPLFSDSVLHSARRTAYEAFEDGTIAARYELERS